MVTHVLALMMVIAPSRGEPLVQKAPTQGPGVTKVTEKPEVTVTMGLQMASTNEKGDSVEWWPRRQVGWRRWQKAIGEFPRLKSKSVEIYLQALAEGFRKTLPEPKPRFHFLLADTLNPSFWPAGGGFFVIHGGLVRAITDERHFAFIVALELAHEALGHNYQPLRAGDVRWEPGRWREGDFNAWPIEFWALLVGNDPVERGGFGYTLQQESDALELVYDFFRANSFEFDSVARTVADLLPKLAAIPGTSSLPGMHKHLAHAVRIPHRRAPTVIQNLDPIVNGATYQKIRNDLFASDLQRYPWMLELAPYRQLILEKHHLVEFARETENPMSDFTTKKYEALAKKPRHQALAEDLADLEAVTDKLDSRDKMLSAKLARVYMKGLLLSAHKQWKEVLTNAYEGLKLDPKAEPFLWQRALARQQLEQFNLCSRELAAKWPFFDHRREILLMQCGFLDGRYSDIAAQANEYRRKYPFDLDGAFWQTLNLLRIRRLGEPNIIEIESFWGDRPTVRALKIFYFGFLGKHAEAKASVDLETDLRYLNHEWGMLHFAQSWYRKTFNPIKADDRAEKLQELSELEWNLSHLVKRNVTPDVVPKD